MSSWLKREPEEPMKRFIPIFSFVVGFGWTLPAEPIRSFGEKAL